MEVIAQEKLDGISVALNYDKGHLLALTTRGDGETGDEITPHAVHIKGIPQTVPEDTPITVRGELITTKAHFKDTWIPRGWKNPRNGVAGLCKGRSKPEDLATVQLVAYDYHGAQRRRSVQTEQAVTEHLARLGFLTPQINTLVTTPQEAIHLYNQYDTQMRDLLPYETDGLVFKINHLEDQTKFPTTSGRPGWARAVKPSPKAVTTVVTGITWEMGLSGRFSPVAQVEPRDLNGTTLRNVNLFNLDRLKELHQKGFGIGATIEVIRTGDVLPMLSKILIPVPTEP